MGEVIGYARVSTTGQSLEAQVDALSKAGCDPERIYAEKRTGTRTQGRVELARMLEYVRKGDVVVITRLDRLARSTKDLIDIADKLGKKGVQLRCIEQQIDTTTTAGKLFFTMLGAFAEFETSTRKDRIDEGVAALRARGIEPFKGRPAKIKRDEVEAAVAKHGSKAAAAKALGISRDSVYRVLAGT